MAREEKEALIMNLRSDQETVTCAARIVGLWQIELERNLEKETFGLNL